MGACRAASHALCLPLRAVGAADPTLRLGAECRGSALRPRCATAARGARRPSTAGHVHVLAPDGAACGGRRAALRGGDRWRRDRGGADRCMSAADANVPSGAGAVWTTSFAGGGGGDQPPALRKGCSPPRRRPRAPARLRSRVSDCMLPGGWGARRRLARSNG
ncbi:hypothetical protein BU14_0177s0008 [Porphyra umbilicalis]|uniref:Uncharacterized protein n=1 Tax=Porphyra umbilicalis TaxID=2786 RepID=A0A1X6P7C0_PORUM|nr:hypothetical protein BU14_0177s0008 [Porphyra umbilicalis]|eukprot:OSX76727.1 hypothetical protein BU14_0177s0008 [Porphyra umbilicalis]